MKRGIFALMLVSVTAWGAVPESVIQLKPEQGHILFEAVGRPAMVKIKGNGKGPEGTLKVAQKMVTGEIHFSLETLDTGIDLRNEHMKDKYLETKKYPKAVLSLKEVPLPAEWSPEKPAVKEVPFKGELTLHGEKRPIEGTFEINEAKELKAKMELKISDYKIAIPSYLGITVADMVKIQVTSKNLF